MSASSTGRQCALGGRCCVCSRGTLAAVAQTSVCACKHTRPCCNAACHVRYCSGCVPSQRAPALAVLPLLQLPSQHSGRKRYVACAHVVWRVCGRVLCSCQPAAGAASRAAAAGQAARPSAYFAGVLAARRVRVAGPSTVVGVLAAAALQPWGRSSTREQGVMSVTAHALAVCAKHGDQRCRWQREATQTHRVARRLGVTVSASLTADLVAVRCEAGW